MTRIHATAIIDPTAELASTVEVGPWCVVGPNVTLGEHCVLRSHVIIECNARFGEGNLLFPFSVLGGTPQDRKFRGEETWLHVGNGNHVREHVTMHRGTKNGGGTTSIGHRNLFMVGVHVAHDCQLQDEITIANEVMLAGHVHVETGANIGGGAAFHHFVTVGSCALVGGFARCSKDIPPFLIVEGMPAQVRGHNHVQMTRRGFTADEIDAVKQVYKRIFRETGGTVAEKIIELRLKFPNVKPVAALCDSLQASASGVHGRALEKLRSDDKLAAHGSGIPFPQNPLP
ncbi:MAG: acyl-ACP--UDP-N-acetylglucosamine O-acyltransferase [Phycisphaerales bacterium]|nr:acyl-ACP--UDP-N-acetylglucosamine O-acyltransferase [Phycisphaerales bacterium]